MKLTTDSTPSFLTLIVGSLTGLLVMKGIVSPDHADQFTQAVIATVGGAITIASLLGFWYHHTEVTKSKIENQTVTPVAATP